MRKANKPSNPTKMAPKLLKPAELEKARGGYELYGKTANEVLLNAWWDAGATQ